MIGVVLTAGGAGVRFKGEKILAPVLGEPLLLHTLRRVAAIASVREIVLTLPGARLPEIQASLGDRMTAAGVTRLVAGGDSRQESVRLGLAALSAAVDLVLVHDAVRPVFSVAAADRAVEAARREGAAIVAVPARDTLKRVDSEQRIVETVDRSMVWHAETPQAARREVLEEAFARAQADGFSGTDEASLIERIGRRVVVVKGEPFNVKVTEPEDIPVVEALLGRRDDG
jgi:2-C-methyl-D-erythritol 4-phosphate cytidylyltransferase